MKKVGHESDPNSKEDDDVALELNEKHDGDSSHHVDVQSNDVAVSDVAMLLINQEIFLFPFPSQETAPNKFY